MQQHCEMLLYVCYLCMGCGRKETLIKIKLFQHFCLELHVMYLYCQYDFNAFNAICFFPIKHFIFYGILQLRKCGN
jgi:hypothetical protein